MKIKVKNKEDNKVLAVISVDSGGVVFEDGYDEDFYNFVQKNLKKGMPVFRNRIIGDDKNEIIALDQGFVGPEDGRFPEAFKDFILAREYNVYELNTPAEKEIRDILAEYPADENRHKILENLEDMSNLEKTTILKGLKIIEEQVKTE